MSLIPTIKIGDLDLAGAVKEFLALLRSIDAKLSTLIDLEQEEALR